MLITLLDVALVLWLHVLLACCFIMSFYVHIEFEKSTEGGWHNLSGTSSDGQGDRLEEVVRMLTTQGQEKCSIKS